jgi:hypothetical protein
LAHTFYQLLDGFRLIAGGQVIGSEFKFHLPVKIRRGLTH